MVENIRKAIPPYMVMVFALLQDVDWMRKRRFLWINLWVSPPNSLHRKTRLLVKGKAQHLG
jgi:hypothetical protein